MSTQTGFGITAVALLLVVFFQMIYFMFFIEEE